MSLCKAEQLERMLPFAVDWTPTCVISRLMAASTYKYGRSGAIPFAPSLRAVQKTLLQQSARYPNIVCYCFDDFSTLIYAI